MVKFIHTSDWQLGITRRFLDEGAQERYSQARFESVARIMRLARDEGCLFVAVAGDVFESNQVSRRTVGRALEALRETAVPVYLLPANHDPLNEASVYRSRAFLERTPANIHVIEDAAPIAAAPGVEIIGAPWRSKHPVANPVHDALDRLEPARDRLRVCLAHGPVDNLGFGEGEAVIAVERLRAALADGRIHFAALGDRHSLTAVDAERRIWYSGTPEAVDFRETDPGFASVVELGPEGASVRPVKIGEWSFLEYKRDDIAGDDDVSLLIDELDRLAGKERRVVRLSAGGALGLEGIARLEDAVGRFAELFASFEADLRHLHVHVDAEDVNEAAFSGFAAAAVAALRERIGRGGADADAARDALLLLLRLSRGGGA